VNLLKQLKVKLHQTASNRPSWRKRNHKPTRFPVIPGVLTFKGLKLLEVADD